MRTKNDTIIILDFGGQYSHLIARRIRDLGVYAEVMPSNSTKEELEKIEGLRGIILSGGAASVHEPASPKCSQDILDISVPILGICYGHQLLAHIGGGDIIEADSGEYGLTSLNLMCDGALFEGILGSQKVWMNHRDLVASLPEGYLVVAATDNSPIAAYQNNEAKIYGLQFHPEVTHTENGIKILENFVFNICGSQRSWDSAQLLDNIREEIKQTLVGRRAIIGLSGGIDSSVAAIVTSSVIGENLTAVYVDTGLMRQGETDFIQEVFAGPDINLKIIKAEDAFFNALKGEGDPEQKRKIIGRLFIDVFDRVAEKVGAEVLIQGTIYSDRIESGVTQHASTIKSHHNVGGLPKDMKLEVYEPLRDLYKDEVRALAKKLDLPPEVTTRHVFPGPGLAVRILGEVTPKRADIVRRASFIVEDELQKTDLYDKVWMAFAVLLPIKSVGIQGDERSYKYTVAVRIVESDDAMTANFTKVPYEILERISTRITNEISDINRVVYDISNKPPSTMEWE